MLSLVSTALSPVIGFLGSFATGWLEEKKADREQERELVRMEKEKEIVSLENEGKRDIANITRETQADIEGSKNLRAAMKADKASYIDKIDIAKFLPMGKTGKFIIWSLSMVDVARGLIRPVCTSWGMFLLSVMVYRVMSGKTLPTGVDGGLIIFAAVDYVGIMLGFWFGDKMQKRGKK